MARLQQGWVGVLVVTLTVQVLAADKRPDWYPSDEVVAAQAKVKEQRRQAAWAYYEREIIGQYNKVGGKNPKWDKQVLALFRANIMQRIGEYPDAKGLRLSAANQCIGLRPDDPFVFCLLAQTMPGTTATTEDYRRALGTGCDLIMASAYSGIIRFDALCWKAGLKGVPDLSAGEESAPDDMRLAEAILHQALKELDKIAQAKDLPACEIDTIMETAAETSLTLYKDRWKWASQVYAVLAKRQGERSELLTAKAALFTEYAWDARGGGWASTVTPEGWKLMAERLAMAEADLTAAWEKDPHWPGSAIGMLTVELGQGKGRDVMEMWFRRAMALDPESTDAYERKRYYLEGKWHGSDREMLAFAREVAAAVPKASPMRLILWDAHRALAYAGDAGPKQDMESAYFKKHPEAWAELKAMADDVVLAKGASNYSRTEMARAAVNAGDIASARTYLDAADADLSVSVFGEEYERIRSIIDQGR